MSKTLFIIESPGKKKKLQEILGADYRIEASFGHVRDLPENEIGVEPPTFKPKYVIPPERAKATVARLKSAAEGAERVILATDPDREGEAIAWHVAQVLKLKNPERVTYQEIEAKAVKAAMAKPRALNLDLVHAQEARRVLDRLVGYMASPVISQAGAARLSAGRVQSPVVRLVVDRERAIRAFKQTNHFGVVAHFDGAAPWRAELQIDDLKEWIGASKPDAFQDAYLVDRAVADDCATVKPLTVMNVENTQARQAPPAPFTTSTLQVRAQQALKFKPKHTMELAQALYEQGAITYMRTDSPNLSDDACTAIEQIARARNLPLPKERRRFKAKGNAQEAHEAIRPTHFEHETAGETDEQRALYALIWKQAVASQLADAVFDVRSVRLMGLAQGAALSGTDVIFKAQGRTLAEAGWKKLAGESDDDEAEGEGEKESANPVPALTEGAQVTPSRCEVVAKKTKPPVRYKESSLIKEMERRGIGRPSTYAPILTNITSRGYIVEDPKGFLSSTALAEQSIVDALVGRCQFIELDYTSKLEAELDDIAEGKKKFLDVVASMHSTLETELAGIKKTMPAFECTGCGKPLTRRSGTKGVFWGCTGYPNCKCTFPDKDGTPDFEAKKEGSSNSSSSTNESKYTCPKCSKPLRRNTRSKRDDPKGKGWDFWGCTGFRDGCKETFKVNEKGEPIFESSSKK